MKAKYNFQAYHSAEMHVFIFLAKLQFSSFLPRLLKRVGETVSEKEMFEK